MEKSCICETDACPNVLRRGDDWCATPKLYLTFVREVTLIMISIKTLHEGVCMACRSMTHIEILEILGGGRTTTVALCSSSDLRVAVKMYHRDQMTSLNLHQVRHQKFTKLLEHTWTNVLHTELCSMVVLH